MTLQTKDSSRCVLYVSRNDGTDTRMSKECNSLLQQGYRVIFLGWDRTPELKKSNPIPDVEKHIFRYSAGFRSISLLFSIWRYYVFLLSTLIKIKPDIVHAVNEDLGIMLAPVKPFLKFKLILDIYDSFSLRFASANIISRLVVGAMCKVSWWVSDAILVTDQARLNQLKLEGGKTWIVSNFPVDPGELNPGLPEDYDSRIYLYVAGTLYKARGLEQVTAVLDSRENVYTLCAGWCRDDCAERFVKHPKVDYLGIITPAESLECAASCDAILALYKPENDNMLLASPNKIYDAMCVGKPVIINSEARISNWVREVGVGYTCQYSDLPSLLEIVDEIGDKKFSGSDNSAHIRSIFADGYSWQNAAENMFRAYRYVESA